MSDTGLAIILRNQTAPPTGSNGVYADINDELEYVPRTALREAFVAQRVSLVNKDLAGVVSSIRGLLGNVAANAVGLRPTYSAISIAGAYPGLTGNGIDQVLLNTSVPMPASGYLVVGFQRPAAPNSLEAYAGGATDAGNRAYLGHRTSGGNILAAGAIGSLNQNTLSGTTPLVDGGRYVVGMRWHAGTAILRVNKVQENSQPYTNTAGTKNLALNAYANGGSGLLYSKTPLGIVALYSGDDTVLNNSYLDEIDAGVGVPIGLEL